MNAPPACFVVIEQRLTNAEADALAPFLEKFVDLIESQVMSCPEGTRDDLVSGLKKIQARLAERQPPFEDG